VSNSPSWEDSAVLNFFETSTRNLLTYGAEAGVKHFVALSVVGTERLPRKRLFRAKIAQEKLIKNSSTVPYSIVQATQFFEFLKGIADISMRGDKVHLPPMPFQPMAADDVATAVGQSRHRSAGEMARSEIAGPERFRTCDRHRLRRRFARRRHDPREVVTTGRAILRREGR